MLSAASFMACTRTEPSWAPSYSFEDTAQLGKRVPAEYQVSTLPLAENAIDMSKASPLTSLLRKAGWLEGYAMRIEAEAQEGLATVHATSSELPRSALPTVFETVKGQLTSDQLWEFEATQEPTGNTDNRRCQAYRIVYRAEPTIVRSMVVCLQMSRHALAYLTLTGMERNSVFDTATLVLDELFANIKEWEQRTK
ncbi:MAG: hypothetical protein AB7N24_03900 [Dehalococcoidia bacterium]